GSASWQFGAKKDDAEKKEASLPTFGRLVVGDGHVLYADAILPVGVDARFALSDGTAPGRSAPATVPASTPSPASASGPALGGASGPAPASASASATASASGTATASASGTATASASGT